MKPIEITYFTTFLIMIVVAGMFLINSPGENNESEIRSALQEIGPQAGTSAENKTMQFYTEELQTLLAQHFKMDYSNPVILLNTLLDPAKYDSLIRINYLRNLSMDLGINLEHLKRYGLVRLGNGSYEIDNQLYPGWLPLDAVLAELLSDVYVNDILTPILLQRGIDQINLNALNVYLEKTDPQLAMSRMTLKILDDEIGKIESIRIEKERRTFYTLLSVHINEMANHANSLILKEWAVGLMKQLDTPSQEILFLTLSENLGTTKLFSSPLENSVDGMVEEISSGQLRNEYRNLLNGLSQTTESLK